MIDPINSGSKSMVESTPQIDINDLIKSYNKQAKKAFLESQLKLNNVNLELTTSKANFGDRYWFKCPICAKRVQKIYFASEDRFGCRSCLGLKYRSQRYKGMIEQNIL